MTRLDASHDLMELKKAALLQRLKQKQSIKPQHLPEIPVIPKERRSGALALSYAQERLWVIAQMDARASAAYHIHGALRLRGRLNEAALVRALDRIVQRHEALRTRFVSVEGEPRQLIDPPRGFAL